MGTRFFWLPWQIHPKFTAVVGGSGSRWNAGPLAGDPLSVLKQGDARGGSPWLGDAQYYSTDLGASGRPVYAVTTDAARVPLTTTPITISRTPTDTFPRAESWYFSYYAQGCSYLNTTATEVRNANGPFFGWQYQELAFFTAYETMGITSIDGSIFSQAGACPDLYFPYWTRTSRVAPYSSFLYLGTQARGGWYSSGVAPVACYVLRPSTGAIIGWLGQSYINGGYGPQGTTTQATPLVIPDAPKELLGSQGNSFFPYVGDVSGIQDHDLIVWEWWFEATTDYGGANGYWQAQYPPPWSVSVQTHFGGGLSGQPFTVNGGTGMPNWAPAHGTSLNISGIEPDPISSIRTTNISASLGSVSGSTGLTVIN
jgi:hypothetical protein